MISISIEFGTTTRSRCSAASGAVKEIWKPAALAQMHKSFARDIRSVLRVDAHVIYRENSNVWIRYLVAYGVRCEILN